MPIGNYGYFLCRLQVGPTEDYCLRQLGFPVLEVNVDDDQIDDAIDDALQYYRERHYDGVEHMYLKHLFTAADKTKFETSVLSSVNGTLGRKK